MITDFKEGIYELKHISQAFLWGLCGQYLG